MKTQITFKDKFFWEMKKYPNQEIYWVLELNGLKIYINKISDGNEWVVDQSTCNKFYGVFDYNLFFRDDAKAKKYVEDKLLKWIKSIITIKV